MFFLYIESGEKKNRTCVICNILKLRGGLSRRSAEYFWTTRKREWKSSSRFFPHSLKVSSFSTFLSPAHKKNYLPFPNTSTNSNLNPFYRFFPPCKRAVFLALQRKVSTKHVITLACKTDIFRAPSSPAATPRGSPPTSYIQSANLVKLLGIYCSAQDIHSFSLAYSHISHNSCRCFLCVVRKGRIFHHHRTLIKPNGLHLSSEKKKKG